MGAALVKAAERVADAMPWVEPRVVEDDLIPDELPRAAVDQRQREPAAPSRNAPRNAEPPDSAPENLDPTEHDAGSIPVSDAELEASVAISSGKPNDVVTQPELAKEVDSVDQHPESVEGAPPNRKAKIGDRGEHEIAETSGGGCQRQSNNPIELDKCPVVFEEQTKKPLAGEDLPAEHAEINERDLAGEEPAEGAGSDLTEPLGATSNAPDDAATAAPDQSTASGQQANTPTTKATASDIALTERVTSYQQAQETIREIRRRKVAKENRLTKLRNLVVQNSLANKKGGTMFPATVDGDDFDNLEEVSDAIDELAGGEDRRNKAFPKEGEIARDIKTLKELESITDKLSESLKKRLRGMSPGDTLRKKFRTESGGEDKVFGGQARTGISPDHIVPFSEIIEMDGFSVLDEKQMVEVLNWEENLIAMDSDKNSTRGNKRWQEWQGDAYSLFDASVGHDERLRKIAEMIAMENDLRPKIQAMIHDRVKKRLGK